ncbi:hypothetical protein BJ546DRAFT_48373 [Cryomyces antarcticus]
MSSYLWKHYLEDDVDSFRHLLETAGYNVRLNAQRSNTSGQTGRAGAVTGSPGALGSSPTLTSKSRKSTGWSPAVVTPGGAPSAVSLTRADINWKDANGLTILHYAASSNSPSAIEFATALLEHPLTDLYIQDLENGWTALHRAFYFGNITIARAILERDVRDALGRGSGGAMQQAGGLIKIKDKEGNGPFDVFATTIKDRTLRSDTVGEHDEGTGDDEDDHLLGDSGDPEDDTSRKRLVPPRTDLQGDEVFTFGSNKNITLGFGDEDDRQYPERVSLKRPDHLMQRFYRERLSQHGQRWASLDPSVIELSQSSISQSKPISELPSVIRSRPLIIQDVQMSKLHTAVLTTDPEANLYMCGHGPGGRLGTGSEVTQFHFTCIEVGALAGKRIVMVALRQNHTLALSDEGVSFTWGNNGFGQLGYTLPKTTLRDEDPIQTSPRQVFGPLKREVVVGVAASRIHSVAHTTTSLFTFGKNEGQLGIMDSDARSLEVQAVPRKVAASLFSSTITSVSAIDRATVCLLENHEVWVFANYGYTKVSFPLDGFTNYFLKNSFLTTKYDTTPNRICKITAGGDTICAMSSTGEIFTVTVSQRTEGQIASVSTTNPSKIRGALSQPQRIWSLKKGHMAARDVGVDADGSIILTTEAGSVWRRTRRAKIKDATAAGTGDYKPKDYKFSRVPGLTRVTAVRASAFGAYAAVRKDCDVTKTQIVVEDQTIWADVFPLLSFRALASYDHVSDSESEDPRPRFWQTGRKPAESELLRKRILEAKDLEKEVADVLQRTKDDNHPPYDLQIGTTHSALRIPVHRFVMNNRSKVLREIVRPSTLEVPSSIPDVLSLEPGDTGCPTILLQGVDFLTVINLVLYLYTDAVVDFWHFARHAPKLAFRYQQVRMELMKLASKLDLPMLEPAVRQMVKSKPCLDMDMELAIKDPAFFSDGDVEVQLADGEFRVHSALVTQRCPFFQGLFKGRAGGRWLAERRNLTEGLTDIVNVDLRHVESGVFLLVLRHIYADTGEELFDDVVTDDLDEFLNLVMDVMGVANELMLDRLSQICQKTVGRFVTVRNACSLLNAIAPSSVTEFKDAGLEFLCLSLEAMLENGLLDELDEDLLLELDGVVRENQLACLPFAKSGRAEALLHQKYPELAGVIDRGTQAKIDSIMVLTKYTEGDRRVSTSLRAHSIDDNFTSPLQQRARRKSSREPKPATSGSIMRPGATKSDFMFSIDCDEEESLPRRQEDTILGSGEDLVDVSDFLAHVEDMWYDLHGKMLSAEDEEAAASLPPKTGEKQVADPATTTFPATAGTPWGATSSQANRVDMKDILTQTSKSTTRTSHLSLGLSNQVNSQVKDKAYASATAKLSQRERKRLQQARQLQSPHTSVTAEESSSFSKPSTPWQIATGQEVALKDVLGTAPAVSTQPAKSPSVPQQPSRTVTAPQLTMRQTVANPKPASQTKSAPGPFPNQSASQRRSGSRHEEPHRTETLSNARSPTSLARPQPSPHRSPLPHLPTAASPSTALPAQKDPKLSSQIEFPSIQSIRHQSRPVEPSLQLSMVDILSQQQAEKDVIKEAAAKRSLQDIQQEQEFQEWWDKEAARVKENEELTKTGPAARGARKGRGRGGRGGGESSKGGGRGGKGRITEADNARGEIVIPSAEGAERQGSARGRAAAGRTGKTDED